MTLEQLFAVPREARDDSWVASFFATIPQAPLATIPEPVMQGPDGFPYFVLKLPPGEPRTLAGVVELCTDRGVGVVIEPKASGPEWVFDYGSLFSYRAYGMFDGDPNDREAPHGPAKEALAKPTQVLIGAPDEAFLPTWARRVVARFLNQVAGVKEPAVCLMIEPSRAPTRNLVFNVHPEDFASEADFQRVLNRLYWFMPRGRSVIAVSRNALAGAFVPL